MSVTACEVTVSDRTRTSDGEHRAQIVACMGRLKASRGIFEGIYSRAPLRVRL